MRGGCACKYSEGIKVTGALDAIEGMDRDGGRLFVMNAFGIAGVLVWVSKSDRTSNINGRRWVGPGTGNIRGFVVGETCRTYRRVANGDS